MGRRATAVDAVAERYLETYAALDPCAATEMGIVGHDDDITDYSPDGVAARADAAARRLRELDGVAPDDDVDVVTVAAMRERLGVQLELHDAGLDVGELNVIASPLQSMRDVFDLMATDTEDDWRTISQRLSRVPDRVAGYATSLRAASAAAIHPRFGRSRGASSRQADPAAVRRHGGRRRTRQRSAARRTAGTAPRQRPMRTASWRRCCATRSARTPAARTHSAATPTGCSPGCSSGRPSISTRPTNGVWICCNPLWPNRSRSPTGSIPDRRWPRRCSRLDEEPRYVVDGTDALQAWMQELSDRVVDALADTHFEIDEPLRNLECRIAPTQTGGIYYTGPSEDLTRPGRMWWSVPPGVDTFHTWQETTTVFHEGVPGHHLQIGRAVVLADQLNRWRRLGCWVSGHGEGWALYAERLMAELGWLDDAGNRMGMLDAQRFRAARVVIDIGVHCGMTAPDGGVWDAEKAWMFLQSHSAMKEANLRFELDRYLGWPGQAPSYAIGQRIWQQLRDELVGRGTSLKEFHRRALDLGGLPLDVLRSALSQS